MMLARGASAVVRAVAACAAGIAIWQVNPIAGCERGDMAVLLACAPPTRADLLHRVANAPGDIWAYKDLALGSPEPQRSTLVATALSLYAQEPNLQWARAMSDAARGDGAAAAGLLVTVVEHTGDVTAIDALAKLILAGGTPLLRPHLKEGTRWVERVSMHLPEVPGALRAGVPFIADAVKSNALSSEKVLSLIDSFKAEGAVLEGFALWVQLQGRPVALLRNGNFADPINATPFDWQTPRGSKAGFSARVFRSESVPFAELSFDGKSVLQPMLRQYVMAPPGRYRLEGEYRQKLRAYGSPPAWMISCWGTPVSVLGVAPLAPASTWTALSLEFDVPPECPGIVTVDLSFPETSTATVGGVGLVAVRAIRLLPLH